jgi:organic hydroperoxide reductase OsmC/OhrA
MSTRARSFGYAVELDDTWEARSERGGMGVPADEEHWAPEHLVLAGLARCSLTSLRYHCRRAGVEIAVRADVAFEPKPDDATVTDLLLKGERDCFVGASLTAQPTYDWHVA